MSKSACTAIASKHFWANSYLFSLTKIFHYARFDVAALKCNLEINTKNIFCTKIAKEGSKTIQEKIQVAKNLLEICENNEGDKLSSSRILDKLMETINDEDNFLTEDWFLMFKYIWKFEYVQISMQSNCCETSFSQIISIFSL